MALAKLFASQKIRPKASILFVGWGAEEAGLVGSDYYVKNPKYLLNNTLASLVLDVVGRGDGPRLFAEGNPESLLETIRSSAAVAQLPLGTENGGGGSDHEPFLNAQVPSVLFIWEGGAATIHRADDTIEKIEIAKLRATGVIVALTALNIAGLAP
jgi:Zn-dependent M28 family amino/carboxypeptidase